MIVEGSSTAIEAFEKKVTEALEIGYSLAGELLAKTQGSEIKFFQPVIMAEEEDEDEWEDEDEEDED